MLLKELLEKPRLVEIRGTYGRPLIHVVYANLNFEETEDRGEARKLLQWLKSRGLPRKWTQKRTLAFLKRHQEEFRACLRWLCRGGARGYSWHDESFLKEWHKEPHVRFFQEHALEHGGIRIEPRNDSSRFVRALQIVQMNQRDPLDIICWSMLALAVRASTLLARPCGYLKCGKFVEQVKKTKRFCNASCRSLEHQRRRMQDDPERFRKDRADFMRKNRLDHKVLRKS